MIPGWRIVNILEWRGPASWEQAAVGMIAAEAIEDSRAVAYVIEPVPADGSLLMGHRLFVLEPMPEGVAHGN